MGAFKRLDAEDQIECECVLAIDPGTLQSAYVVLCGEVIYEHGIAENQQLLQMIRGGHFDFAEYLAIEMIACYGKAVGAEVFRTCVWIGRFEEAWGEPFYEVLRKNVKMHVLGKISVKNADTHVKKAMLSRFGESGTKRQPGALYGMNKHAFQALAVAVTWMDRRRADGLFR